MGVVAWALVTSTLAATASATEPTSGQEGSDRDASKERARELAERGARALDDGDPQAALSLLREALSLVAVPTIGIEVARTLVALERLEEANQTYRNVEAMTLDPSLPEAFAEVQRSTQRVAERERIALDAQRPTIALTLDGPMPDRMSVNGRSLALGSFPMQLRVDPGEHVVEAHRGSVRWRQRRRIARGETLEMRVRLPAASDTPAAVVQPHSTPPSGHDTPPPVADTGVADVFAPLGWTAIGLGGASAVVALATYLRAASIGDDLERRCPDEVCRTSTAGADVGDEIASYDRLRTISTATFGVAVGLGAIGTAFVVTASVMDSNQSTVTFSVTPTSATFTGRF
jgi:hypothetical protein